MCAFDTSLIFYTNPQSRGRVVHWMLEEVGCAYETRWLEYGTTMKDAEYLSINPAGKVPAIRHGDAVVTETVAICTYLADVFPEAGLVPDAEDREAKAAYYRWLFFVAGPLEAAVANKILNVKVSDDMKRAIGHGGIDEVVAILESLIKGKDYIAGNRFTTADLVLCSYIGFYMSFDVLPKTTEFERYVKLHTSRPAFLKVMAMNENSSAAS